MATFDLKPLSQETIEEFGFNNHDLWMVKIDEETYGPFESLSLKHYANENQKLFDHASATRLDQEDYQPFWTIVNFQRRTPEMVNSKEQHLGPFWTLDNGQKHGPHSYNDIDKKIEMGLLVMTDHLSADNGETWKKIYEYSGFDRRAHTPNELPEAPNETAFQKAKLVLAEKLEKPHTTSQEQLAELAHHGQREAKVLTLKLEEMTIQNLKNTEVSESLKWAVPGAAAAFVLFLASGYLIFNPSSSGTDAELALEESSSPNAPRAPHGEVPVQRPSVQLSHRSPASVQPYNPPPMPSVSSYPTRVETHMRDSADETPMEPQEMPEQQEPPPQQEHSLVGNENQPQDQSLDAAMNGTAQPTEPVVEEASDF